MQRISSCLTVLFNASQCSSLASSVPGWGEKHQRRRKSETSPLGVAVPSLRTLRIFHTGSSRLSFLFHFQNNKAKTGSPAGSGKLRQRDSPLSKVSVLRLRDVQGCGGGAVLCACTSFTLTSRAHVFLQQGAPLTGDPAESPRAAVAPT